LSHFKNLFQQKSLAKSIQEKENVPLKKYYRAVCQITPRGKEFLDLISHDLPHCIIEDVIPKVPYPIIKKGITKILAIGDSVDDV